MVDPAGLVAASSMYTLRPAMTHNVWELEKSFIIKDVLCKRFPILSLNSRFRNAEPANL